MRQQTALNLCRHMQIARNSHCEVVPPDTFTEIARLSKKEAAERAAKKARKKKKRRSKKKRKRHARKSKKR